MDVVQSELSDWIRWLSSAFFYPVPRSPYICCEEKTLLGFDSTPAELTKKATYNESVSLATDGNGQIIMDIILLLVICFFEFVLHGLQYRATVQLMENCLNIIIFRFVICFFVLNLSIVIH